VLVTTDGELLLDPDVAIVKVDPVIERLWVIVVSQVCSSFTINVIVFWIVHYPDFTIPEDFVVVAVLVHWFSISLFASSTVDTIEIRLHPFFCGIFKCNFVVIIGVIVVITVVIQIVSRRRGECSFVSSDVALNFASGDVGTVANTDEKMLAVIRGGRSWRDRRFYGGHYSWGA
jgi:hypothetical protein